MSTDAMPIVNDLMGQTVSQVRFDFSVTLLTDDGWWIVIEGPGRVDDCAFVSGNAAPGAGGLVRLHRGTIEAAKMDAGGALTLGFDTGQVVVAGVSTEFDSWHIVAPDHRRLYVEANGRVVVFDAPA